MSIPQVSPGDVIDVRPLNAKLRESKTHTLLKTDDMEVIRLVMPAGKIIPEHKALGEITVQCLEGKIRFGCEGSQQILCAGEMLFLTAAQPHAVEAIEDSSILVTLLLRSRTPTTQE